MFFTFIQSFDLLKLPDFKRLQVAHYLNRHNRLHNPSINRFFYSTAVDARSRRADIHSREYIGFSHSTQGQFESSFGFALLTEPLLSASRPDTEESLKSIISSLNKIRPKFIVSIGNLTAFEPTTPSYAESSDKFRRAMARVLDTISCLYVPGALDVGYPTMTDSSLSTYLNIVIQNLRTEILNHDNSFDVDAYRDRFGADYYGFWYGGIRLLVVNSSLLILPEDPGADHPSLSESVRTQKRAQDDWLSEEIEQAKLAAHHALIFSYHCWVAEKEAAEFNIDRFV